MEQDEYRYWVQQTLTDIKNRLDSLPCGEHGEAIASFREAMRSFNQQLDNHKKLHEQSWTKGNIIGGLMIGVATVALSVVGILVVVFLKK